MKPVIEHPWNVSPEEAIKIQNKLKKLVKEEKLEKEVKVIGGVDISYNYGENILFGGIVLMSIPELKVIKKISTKVEVNFPYIPGLLAFREIPCYISLFEKIDIIPDVIMVDGHGISHPRFFGIASHLGVIFDIPTIGVAKRILVGKPDFIPTEGFSFIRFKEKIVGALLKTKGGNVVVSVGHKITLQEAIKITLLTTKGKIPEPTYLAHIFVNEERKKDKK